MPRATRQLQQASQASQASQSQPQTSATPDVAAPELSADQLVINMVKTICRLAVRRLPIRKADLVKHALKGNGRAFADTFANAVVELKEVYGYRVVEMEPNKTYLVCTVLPQRLRYADQQTRQNYGLLFIVLAYIFMKGGRLKEQIVYKFLEKLKITTDGDHPVFGNVTRLLDTFVKQTYLCRTKEENMGYRDDVLYLSWGIRAECELSRQEVLNTVSEQLNKRPIYFVTQYIEAFDDGTADDSAMSMDE